jgi:hypothetical protein
MTKNAKPFTLIHRTDSKSFRLTLNPSCGLPDCMRSGHWPSDFKAVHNF